MADKMAEFPVIFVNFGKFPPKIGNFHQKAPKIFGPLGGVFLDFSTLGGFWLIPHLAHP